MSKLTEGLSKEEIKQVRTIFFRTFNIDSCFNHVRQFGHGCAHALRKYIEWLYPGEENKEKRIEAMQRESVIYNITPFISTLGTGLFASMEKEAKENHEFDPSTINSIKVSIMGPASGIGDSLFWVTLRVMCASIAIPFALKGSILGAFIFIGTFDLIHYFCKYYLTFISYKAGSSFIAKAFKDGSLPAITRAATIMGLVMVGCMISSTVDVPLTLAFSAGDTEVSIANIFNDIIPGLLGLLLSLGVFKMLRKKVNPNLIIVLLFAVSLIGAAIGIF